MADIARLAGVSVPTVSYVLNGQSAERRIAEATTRRVLEAAESLGYVRNNIARSLRRRETFAVAILVPDLAREWANRVVLGAQRVFDPAGYFPSVHLHQWDSTREARELQLMIEEQKAAIIARPMEKNLASYRRVIQLGIPLVLLDGIPGLDDAKVCMWDMRDSIRRSIATLASMGRRRVALMSVDRGLLSSRFIREAFDAALLEHRIESRAEWLCIDRHHSLDMLPNRRFRGYGDSLRALFTSGAKLPDAVLCTSDALATTCVTILRDDLGIAVPAAVAVLGMGDHGESRLTGISTCVEPLEEVGRQAATIALAMIRREVAVPPITLLQYTMLALRGTTPPIDAKEGRA